MEKPVMRAVVADDHPIVVEGVCSLLLRVPGLVITARAASGTDVLSAVRESEQVDLAVIDLSMPGLNGIETTRALAREFPRLKIILLTVYSGLSFVRAAFEAGAHGYVVKAGVTDCLIEAVREVFRGSLYLCPMLRKAATFSAGHEIQGASSFPNDEPLTGREREVLQLVASGLTNRQIADRLCISIKTVSTHREHIMEKLEIHTVAGLTKYAIEQQLVDSMIHGNGAAGGR